MESVAAEGDEQLLQRGMNSPELFPDRQQGWMDVWMYVVSVTHESYVNASWFRCRVCIGDLQRSTSYSEVMCERCGTEDY